MTEFPESHRDLLDGQFASFATIGRDGVPQSTLVWFLYEDGDLKLSLNTSRLKTKHLRKRPQFSLLIPDPESQFRYLELHGTARIDPDDDRAFAKRVGDKYGTDVNQFDGPGDERLVVTLEPSNVYAVDNRG
jgi:PPOX class probable F420-dependent enzyme